MASRASGDDRGGITEVVVIGYAQHTAVDEPRRAFVGIVKFDHGLIDASIVQDTAAILEDIRTLSATGGEVHVELSHALGGGNVKCAAAHRGI